MQEVARSDGGEEQAAPLITSQWLSTFMGKMNSFENMQAQLGMWMRELLDR